MRKFYEKDGRVFMIVFPTIKLMHSKLISDVMNNGGSFVVDMNTGQLTVDRSHLLDEVILKREEKKIEKKYSWWRGPGKGSRKLSNDIDVATVQLADEWAMGYQKGRLYVNGQCKVNDSDLNWRELLCEVRKAYEV